MGIPVEKRGASGDYLNPLGTDGMVFAEFSAVDPLPIVRVFESTGFKCVARHATRAIEVWRQGGVEFLLNSDPATHGGAFARIHGPCISALAFRIANGDQSLARAAEFGALPYTDQAKKTFDAPAIEGIGGSLLYLVDPEHETAYRSHAFAGLQNAPDVPGTGVIEVDHLTHNVMIGNVDVWADFYRNVFGFREIWYYTATGKSTGLRTKAMKSPCNKICIPVNEATEDLSQIQEWIQDYQGEGVQHIALLSNDLNATIEQVASHNITFMPIPESYYQGVDSRLPDHGQDVARLQRNGILLDGSKGDDDRWELLLQVFSKNVVGPIFFEFIQRQGNDGFGEGNAKALFEAIERDQIERGVVAA